MNQPLKEGNQDSALALSPAPFLSLTSVTRVSLHPGSPTVNWDNDRLLLTVPSSSSAAPLATPFLPPPLPPPSIPHTLCLCPEGQLFPPRLSSHLGSFLKSHICLHPRVSKPQAPSAENPTRSRGTSPNRGAGLCVYLKDQCLITLKQRHLLTLGFTHAGRDAAESLT